MEMHICLKTKDTQSRAVTSTDLTDTFGRAAPSVMSKVGKRGDRNL